MGMGEFYNRPKISSLSKINSNKINLTQPLQKHKREGLSK